MEQYADVIIDPQGNVVVGAMVSILDSQGAPAQIFGSNNQNSSINNPILTGSLGEFSFFARNGRYRIGNVLVGGRVFQAGYREIILNDPDDGAGGLPGRVGALESNVAQLDIEADAATQALDALQLPDYAALRAYKGPRKSVYVTGAGIAGMFVRRDMPDATDNGGTRIVGEEVWDRVFDGPVVVEWFGAKGDYDPNTGGGSNDTTSIQAALNACAQVCLSPGKYYKVNGLVGVAKGAIFTLVGRAWLVNGSGTGNTLTITLPDFDLSGVNFEGGNSGAAYSLNTVAEGSCFGLVIAGAPGALKNVNISNCDLRGFSASAVFVGETAATGLNDKSVSFENVHAHNNYCNFELSGKAEYIVLTNCHGYAGRIGIKKQGGNNKATNCNFTQNYYNCWLTAGGNDSHGSWIGCSFNHHAVVAGARSLLAQTITYGEEFVGCKFWYGDIELSYCTGVRISNGQIAGSTITVTNGHANWIHDNMLYGAITKAFTLNPRTEWRNNRYATDYSGAAKNNFLPQHYLVAKDSTVHNFTGTSTQNLFSIAPVEGYLHSVSNTSDLMSDSVFKFPESNFYDVEIVMNLSAPSAVAQTVTVTFCLTDASAIPVFDLLSYKVFVPASASEFSFTASGSLFVQAGWLGLVQVTPGIAAGVNVLSSRYTVKSKS